MSQALCLLHTVGRLASAFEELCREMMPDVECFSISDEGILRVLRDVGHVTPDMQRRFTEDVVWAEEAGADAVLVTCSTVSPCVDEAQDRVAIPVVKIDQAMIDKAIHIGTSIGVVATAATTLEPSCELVKSRSRAAGKDTVIHSVLCEGALEAMLMGEDERHDAIVLPYLYDVMEKSEVVILAQASMARILDRIPEDERQVPVLSSPRLAVEHVCGLLEQP